jgi:hypothetical protein
LLAEGSPRAVGVNTLLEAGSLYSRLPLGKSRCLAGVTSTSLGLIGGGAGSLCLASIGRLGISGSGAGSLCLASIGRLGISGGGAGSLCLASIGRLGISGGGAGSLCLASIGRSGPLGVSLSAVGTSLGA